MNMSFYLSLLIGLSLCPGMSAQTISVTEAHDRAQAFFGSSHRARGANAQRADLQLAYTSVQNDETHYYVFNDLSQSGFVVVSGDECAPAEILGYSANGPFNYESAPAGMKWWLGLMDAQIHANIKQGVKPQPKTAFWGESVPAMITSKWGQLEPYNNAVPLDYYDDVQYAGCVAIAMSQIMNYHQWPTQGSGSYSYYDTRVDYSADFGSTIYDWDHILDTYDENSTQEEIDAVSTLVYHAGVSVHSRYGWYETRATSPKVPYALNKYFGYDASVRYLKRDYFDDSDWFYIIHGQLENGRPVYYDGGGHAFVCHGYDADTETFAINWGWNGNCDGYYRLFGEDVLHAIDDEGKSHGEYDSRQGMVINIRRNRGGKPVYSLCAYHDVTLSDGESQATHFTVSAKEPKTIRIKELNPINYSIMDLSFKLGAIVEDWSTGTEYVFCSSDYVHTDPVGEIYLNHSNQGYYAIDISIPTDQLPYNGSYGVYPAYKVEGTDEWRRIMLLQSNDELYIDIVDGKEHGEDEQDDMLDITYTMTEAEWGTICLPYDAEIPEELTAYSVTGINGNLLELTQGYSLDMNTPYLLNGPAGEYFFQGPNTLDDYSGVFGYGLLRGITQPSTDDSPLYAPADSYILQNHDGRVAFYRVASDNTNKLRQFRAYLELPDTWDATPCQSQYYLPGSANAIEPLSAQPAQPAAVYNLYGQRTTPQHSGLQIRNGRVLFVK